MSARPTPRTTSRRTANPVLRIESLEDRAVPSLSPWWADADVGGPARVGSSAVDDAAHTAVVSGGGAGAGTTADQLHFSYRQMSGDGSVVARLADLGNTAGTAGLMMRSGTGAGAAEADVLFSNTTGAATFHARTADNATATTGSVTAGASPWLKIVRDGPLVSGYVSATGADGSWTLVGSAAVKLGDTAEAGLAATSADNSGLANASFVGLGVSNAPPMGANLDSVVDWSYSDAFVDLQKQSRSPRSPDYQQDVPTDATGWATTDFTNVYLTGTDGIAHAFNGTYKLSFTGQATLSPSFSTGVTIANQVYNPASNTTTADIVLNAPENPGYEWHLALSFTNTQRTPGGPTNSGVTNIKLIRPGYDASNPPTFTREFLQQISRFSTLRFMDWAGTNDSTQANWSDRVKPTDASQAAKQQVAWEYMIQLANQTGKDLWINIPAHATNDYVTQLAQLFKTQLNPDRAVYVEYSNEVWNYQFEQAGFNKDQAVAEAAQPGSALNYDGDTNPYELAWRRVGEQIVRVSNLFRSVWGDAAMNTRVRPVLAGQEAVEDSVRQPLNMIAHAYGDPRAYLYATAGAPYFQMGDANNNPSLTADQVLAALSAGVQHEIGDFGKFNAVGGAYGLPTLAYEGGPDTFGPNSVAAKKAATLDPRMAGLMQTYLSNYFSQNGGLFMWFNAGASSYDSQYGTWTLTNDPTNLNTPKLQAIDAVLAAPYATPSAGLPALQPISAQRYEGSTNPDGPVQFPWLGQELAYQVNAPLAGTYNLALRYSAGGSGGPILLRVNGQVLTPTLSGTGDWNNYVTSAAQPVSLRAGLNTVQIEVLVGQGYNIDSLQFSSTVTQTSLSPANSAPVALAATTGGTPTALTAQVKTASGATASGTVNFYDGSAVIGSATLDSTGSVTWTPTNLAGGAHLIQAVYAGASGLAASSSPAVSVMAGGTIPAPTAAATTTTLTGSGPSVAGQSVTLTALVASAGGAATGAVQFLVDGAVIGQATVKTVNGRQQASVSLGTLTVGAHTVQARYVGASGFAASTSSSLSQTVSKASTATTLTASGLVTMTGQPVMLTATVRVVAPGAGAPTGTVVFTVDGVAQAPATVVGGRATLTLASLKVGRHTITVKYNGDGRFVGSTSVPMVQTVNRASTGVALSSPTVSPTAGQPVKLTAKVAVFIPGQGLPTGTVIFRDGTTVLGVAAVDSTGTATLTTPSLSAGNHAVTAAYSGDTSFSDSTSAALTVSVQPVTISPSSAKATSPLIADFGSLTPSTALGA
jgi:hypothetical protein